MRGLNKAQIIGNLGQDPELRYTGSGTAVCNLSVATNNPRRDETEWHRVTAWGDLAEIVNEHLAKGRRVYVEGEMRTREWEDRDGNQRETTEIHADEVIFLGGDGQRSTDSSTGQELDQGPPQKQERTRSPAGAGAESQGQDEVDFEPDDELPF
jgi:single-strand DNA-binding protein